MDGPWHTTLINDIVSGQISFQNNIIYIASSSGLFKTTNNGLNYTKIIDGNCTAVYCYKNNPNIVYFSMFTSGSYTYKSIDFGQTFELINNGITNTVKVNTIKISPIKPDKVFAGIDNNNGANTLFMTLNAGNLWTGITYSETYQAKIQEICFSNLVENKIFLLSGPGFNCNTYGAGIYMSDDGGFSWKPKTIGLPHCRFHSLTIEYAVDIEIEYLYIGAEGSYASYQDGGIFRSSDYGVSWQHIYIAPSDFLLLRDMAVVNNKIYACLDECNALVGLLKSENHGQTWVNINNGMLCPSTREITVTANEYIWTGGYNTVYASTDNGTTFIEKTRGLSKANTTSVSAINNIILGTGDIFHPRYFKSIDYGSNWISIVNDCGFVIGTAIEFDPNNNNIVHSVQRESDETSTYITRSTDQGLNWSFAFSNVLDYGSILNRLNDLKVDPNNSSRVFAVGNLNDKSKVLSSTDFGVSYSENFIKRDNTILTFAVQSIEIDKNVIKNGYSKYVYAGGKYSGGVNLYRKQNGGIGEWNQNDIYSQNVNGDINQIFVAPLNSSISYFTYLATSTGVYRKNSASDVWQQVNNGLNNLNVKTIAVDPQFTNKIVISCDQNNLSTLYYSTDYGDNWFTVSSDLQILINELKYSQLGASILPPKLYAATNKGLYEIVVNLSDDNIITQPIESIIYNYPNPFNTITTFNINLKNISDVEINLYDATGKLIKNVYNGQLNEGNHKISSDFSNLASGVYFYQYKINNSINFTKKLIMIK